LLFGWRSPRQAILGSNAEHWILWEKKHCSEWGSQDGGAASKAGSGGVLEPGNDGEMEQGMMIQQVCKDYQ